MADSIAHRGKNFKPPGEFLFIPSDFPISPMDTVEETRRNRLQMLVKKFGSMASVCEQLGYARNDTARLTRILNANIRHERGGKPYNMGSPMAREIEQKLSLPNAWMDNPLSDIERHEHDPRTKINQLLDGMPPEQMAIALRLLDALAQPTQATGTNGK